MPLITGKEAATKKGFEENIRIERNAKKPIKQAVAIAGNERRRANRGARGR